MADSNIKLYYGYPGAESRVVPAPELSINTELNYANDNIVGYKYTFVLNGYITAINSSVENSPLDGFDEVLKRADEIRNIFNKNGANLIVKDSDDNVLLKAHGSKIININMDPSNNNWVNYINYSINIEFNEVDYIGCDNNSENLCDEIKVNNYASNLVDISKYKIKTFNDNWEINLGDNIYNNLYGLPNEHFEVTYSISAEGYHSYQKDSGYVLPAWEQAKNFCQDRLYKQIQNGLISNILKTYPNNTACDPDPNATPDKIHEITFDGQGLLDLNQSRYDIFNEKISCETSESNGTFSLTYSAIIKDISRSAAFTGHNNVIHTINITKQISDSNTERNIQISVNGTIQGLVRGGLINGNYQLELPQNGSLLINRDNNTTKYDNAKLAYQDVHSYGDFTSTFKNVIGITPDAFGSSCVPSPKQYSSNHNYNEGNITYNATYNSKDICLGNTYYTNITANVQDPIEQIAEFVIPGKQKTYIQKLNTYSQKTVTLNIQGYIQPDCCVDFSLYADRYCANNESLNAILPARELSSAVLTDENHTINPLDGSFNIQRVYTYYDYLGN
jgi:hypothetical protein